MNHRVHRCLKNLETYPNGSRERRGFRAVQHTSLLVSSKEGNHDRDRVYPTDRELRKEAAKDV